MTPLAVGEDTAWTAAAREAVNAAKQLGDTCRGAHCSVESRLRVLELMVRDALAALEAAGSPTTHNEPTPGHEP